MNKTISRKEILNNADEYIKTQNENLKNTPYFIDEKTAFRAIKFISLLKHTAGEFAGVNFQLLDFQIKFIIDTIATFKKDTNSRRYSSALLFIPRKNGKALSINTLIPTPKGFVKMGDLKVGDEVFSVDGKPTKITLISDIMHNHDCYDVKFSDGSSITADKDHIWHVNSAYHYIGNSRKDLNLTTKEMLDLGVIYKRKDDKIEHAFKVQITKAVHFKKQKTTIHPYLLGLWLVYGSSYDARMTIDSHKNEIMTKLSKIGVKLNLVPNDNKNVYYAYTDQKHSHNGFGSTLRKLNLYKNKHIPNEYLFNDEETRLELLRGIMDSDGFVSKAGQCEFCSTNEKLANDMLFLVRSLGLKATLKKSKAMLKGKICSDKFRVFFYAPKSLKISYVDFKQNRLKPKPSKRAFSKAIISITKTKSVPVKCIQVAHPSSLYLAGEAFTPTHNTELLASILLYFLFVDSEKGKEIYCAANETEQAKIVYNATSTMLRQNSSLEKVATIFKSTKTIERNNEFKDFIKVLTANADTKDGLRPYVFVYDELHAAKSGELLKVLEEGARSRNNSLSFVISTAGYNLNGEMHKLYEYAKKVKNGTIKDDSFYAMIFEADSNNWQDEKEWLKANPAMNRGIKLDKLKEAFIKTSHDALAMHSFKTKHLNIWVSSNADSWLSDEEWMKNSCEFKIDEVLADKTLKFYAGLDLSSVNDLTAFVLITKLSSKIAIIPYFWLPSENLRSKSKKDYVSYEQWIKDGFIRLTPGNVIDYAYIQRDILEICKKLSVEAIAFDRWNAASIVTNLGDEGLNMLSFGQGFGSMSAPSKELYTKIMKGELEHFNNPVMRWMATNAVIKTDSAGNIKLDKEKSRDKIDGLIALIMAYGIRKNIQTPINPYESRGIRVL